MMAVAGPSGPVTSIRGEGPIGYIDHPGGEDHEFTNAVFLEGWALDREAIAKVTIERSPRAGDQLADLNERKLVEIGTAVRPNGVRPDVAAAFPDYPGQHHARWSYELRREQLASHDHFHATIHVVAHGINGMTSVIGTRFIAFVAHRQAMPHLFCARPFDSVFIGPGGEVNPYPDCRPEKPYGSLLTQSLEEIWHGPAFTDLRLRIINRDPPPMCLTCANFINSNVNDPGYFLTR